MSDTYSLTVVNESELDRPTFAVFAKLPTQSSYDTLHLAWLTQPINQGNTYVFTWQIEWGFAWASHGTSTEYTWSGSGHLDADPDSTRLCRAKFSYNGDFELSPAAGTPNGYMLWVDDDGTIPLPSDKASSLAVTLGGNAVCSTSGGPNLRQTYTLHPTYYIDAGNYVHGQMVDGTSVSRYQELVYAGGNTALTATLDRDNTWTVMDTPG